MAHQMAHQTAHRMHQPDLTPCDRNSCRCGSSQNCMYYNDNEYGHHHYVAAQGTAMSNCAGKSYDKFNDTGVYGDHAIGNLGGANQLDPYGDINPGLGEYGQVPAYSTTGFSPMSPTCPMAQMEQGLIPTGVKGAVQAVAQLPGQALGVAQQVGQRALQLPGQAVQFVDDVTEPIPIVGEAVNTVLALSSATLAAAAIVAYLASTNKLTNLGGLDQQDLMVIAGILGVVFFFLR